MRILVVSNFYPPFHISGNDLGCQDIVQSLISRRHDIKVLTSTHGIEGAQSDNNIHRMLIIDTKESLDWKDIFFKELINQTVFKKMCEEFEPEISLFFDLSHISVSLVSQAEERRLPACMYFNNTRFITQEQDQWYKLWPEGDRGFKILRMLTSRFDLLPPRRPIPGTFSIFATSYLKNMAVQLKKTTTDAAVIPWGIDIKRFPFMATPRQNPSRLLYVGQIQPDKRIESIIEVLPILERETSHHRVTLTLTGDEKSSADYVEYLLSFAEKLDVLENLRFTGVIPREEMPVLYRSHDILISPTDSDGFSNRPLLESMSSGTAVVSIATDSNSEILEHETNALIIPEDDPDSWAQQIQRLLENPELMASLRIKARNTVEQKFQLEHSIDSLEIALNEVAKKTKTSVLISQKNQRDVPLNNIVRRAKWWVALAKQVVFIRILLRPKFLLQFLKTIYKKFIFFTPHSLHKIIFDLYFILNRRHRKKTGFDSSRIKSILVTQLADIGDVVLTSPFLRELRRFFPDAWIGLSVQPRMLNLIEKCPYVDKVISFDWGASKNWDKYLQGSPRLWIQATHTAKNDLWRHNIDMAVSIRWNEDPCQAASLILMYTSGAGHRIAYKASPSDRMRYGWKDLNRLITHGPARGSPKHEVEFQLDVLRFIGADPSDKRLEVWSSQDDELFALNMLEKNKVSQTDLLIAFAPGAAWSFRRWPADRFIELGNWLQETYKADILIIAAKNEQDLALQIARGLHEEKTLNLAGKTTLREMASILKHCKLFIGNDSGPLHVATAAGVPVVGFYGPGEYQRFKPWGHNHEVLRLGLSCSPCSQNCIFSEPRCIRGISLSQVKKVLARKMASILDQS
jgi:ADP-heptose:LPS heptosyltransferase/glycosyltransferase involved in cell wall biosynthesis